MIANPKEQPILHIENLSVKTKEKILLDNANLRIQPGELVLLVGASGSGKSVFLRLLTGLIHKDNPSFQIQGSIYVDGVDILKKGIKRAPKKVGIVFQEYGLLDEFNILDNLNFAMDHSTYRWKKEERKTFAQEITQNLGIDTRLKISHCSGGQKKRISIARTLAYQPDVIVYDEPTAGLDPANAKKVAQMIQDTQKYYAKTTLVVTHEYKYLAPIADRIIYLDAQNKQFRQVTKTQIEELVEEGFVIENPPALSSPGILPTLQKWIAHFFDTTGQAFLAMVSFFFYLLPLWKKPLWGIRYFFYYLRLVSFLSSALYISIAGAIIGFVITYFTYQFLPFRSYNEPLLIDDILAAVGFALYRIFIPLIATILLAARGGAAITADLGNRVYTKQIDAMRSLGASPERYLYTNILFAFLIGLPFLTFLSFLVARIFSLAIFIYTHPDYSSYFWHTNFHYLLWDEGKMTGSKSLIFFGFSWVLAKTLLCGAVLGVITYLIGMREKNSGRDISHDITAAIIWGTIAVLFIHFGFALFEFEGISVQELPAAQ
ncbi:MAG: ATP-binding cassette domain-containing protein [Planctomycetota bacterium]|nr:MAG: ATP-binding cassette domain-containing protein [Planctomycetota bacterium]